MASKESVANTEKKDEIFGCKELGIEPYMFEPNKGERRETSDDSSEESESDEEEVDEEFEAANGIVQHFHGVSAVNVRSWRRP